MRGKQIYRKGAIMDTNEAMEYLRQLNGEGASQTTQPTSTEDPNVATGGNVEETEDKNSNSPAPETNEETVRETVEPEASETKAAKQDQPQKKKPTKQEQIDHAFTREKKRHKAEIEAKDKEIAELKAKIQKYAPLEQGDFDPNDVKSYIDHKFALQNEQSQLERLTAERDRMVNEDRDREAGERHERQVQECFATDEERQHYWALLKNGGAQFKDFLNKYDRDGAIDSFLGDSKIAPVMVSVLMRNPDILAGIVEKQSAMNKAVALQNLENRLMLQMKLGRKTVNQTGNEQRTENVNKLPITGSQVTNPGNARSSTVQDWNQYLAEHPR